MSVVVLGMEMPSGCADCIFKYVMFRPLVRCDFQARKLLEIDGTGKLPNCPLRPLPDHHGRLIDGDELSDGCDAPHWCRWKSEIDDMPTIIEKESE